MNVVSQKNLQQDGKISSVKELTETHASWARKYAWENGSCINFEGFFLFNVLAKRVHWFLDSE